MDRGKQKYSSEFLAAQPVLKKMIPQLLLSVSIFSFVFSYSSLYSSSSSSSLLHSPKFPYHNFMSANSFPFLTHALNKNCLFLICNGLLVFLAKTSGFIRPPTMPSSDLMINDMLQKRINAGDAPQTVIEAKLAPLLEKFDSEEIINPTTYSSTADRPNEDGQEEIKKLADQCLMISSTESPKEVSIFIAESEEEGGAAAFDLEETKAESEAEAERRTCWLFDDDGEQLYGQQVEEEQEQENEEDDENEELSTEELNQKFEDFIRRMKEEIVINEARQKVVRVN